MATWAGIPGMAAEEPKHAVKGPESRGADVVYVPTPHDVVARMLEMAKLTKDDLLYDLGCGDGRIVVAAAKKYGCRAMGVDIDPVRIAESVKNAKKGKVESLTKFQEGDVFKLDLAPASVVTLYLLPTLNVKLIPQLEKLKPGTRILSHDFDMEGVTPDKIETMLSKEDDVEHVIYLWTVPLKKAKPAPPKADEF